MWSYLRPPIKKFDLSRKVFSISCRPTLMETELKLSVEPSQSYQMLSTLREKDNQQHEYNNGSEFIV